MRSRAPARAWNWSDDAGSVWLCELMLATGAEAPGAGAAAAGLAGTNAGYVPVALDAMPSTVALSAGAPVTPGPHACAPLTLRGLGSKESDRHAWAACLELVTRYKARYKAERAARPLPGLGHGQPRCASKQGLPASQQRGRTCSRQPHLTLGTRKQRGDLRHGVAGDRRCANKSRRGSPSRLTVSRKAAASPWIYSAAPRTRLACGRGVVSAKLGASKCTRDPAQVFNKRRVCKQLPAVLYLLRQLDKTC